MKYEDDLYIDASALDIEWLEQPSLMMEYCAAEAEAEKKLNEAKETLEVVTAQLDKAIRNDPGGYGIEKLTEAAVRNVIIDDDQIQTAKKKANDASYELKMIRGAVRSLDHRKTALENLVKLHGQQYFAGPSNPRDINMEQQAREKRAKRVDSKISIKRKKK